ncbi:internalin, putative [hydrothermal vent metagenome]|uniref:Internalin, putative n=1 Tax=hydrothermal vent metagenome TaxID=652676 RepID=A0A3B0UYE3_9ZZZZ
MNTKNFKNKALVLLLISIVISTLSIAAPINQVVSLTKFNAGGSTVVRGSGACVTTNLQGALANGFLAWAEGIGTHAILIDPTGSGGAGDPGCGGDFSGQSFDVNDVTFVIADETAFSEPGDGLGVITYEVSIHPLATPGDLASGPGAVLFMQTQTINADGSGVYTVTTPFPADEALTEPFFVSWKLISFVSTNGGVVNRASTLWDGEVRPALRQFVDNDGSGFMPQEDFFTSPNGWVDVVVTGDFNAATVDVVLTKTNDAVGVVPMGDGVAYTLSVENTGNTAATSVVLVDTLPAGISYSNSNCSDSTSANVAGSTITFNLSDVTGGSTTTCTINATVTDFGTHVNNATVTAAVDDNTANNDANSTVQGPVEVDMSIVKTSDAVGQVAEDATVVYTLAVTNNDMDDSATNVVVTDILPPQVTYVSNDCGANVAAGTLTWNAGSVAANATVNCNITVTVSGFGTFDNTADVSADETDNTTGNNSSTTTVEGPTSAAGVDLTMQKTSDAVGEQAPNATVTYMLTVTNNSANAATGVMVVDTLPAGLDYVSNTCGASQAGGTVTWNIGNLAANASVSCDLVTTVVGNGNISNTASASSNEPDNNSTDNSATAVISGPAAVDLSMTKTASAPDPLSVGDTIVYTLVVNSVNTGAATGVVVTDDLPAGVTYVSNSCGATVVGTMLTWNIGNLGAGSSVNCNITVTLAAAGTTNNTASVAANETDVVTANNSGSASVFSGVVRVIPTLSFASLLLMILVLGFFGRRMLVRD